MAKLLIKYVEYPNTFLQNVQLRNNEESEIIIEKFNNNIIWIIQN